MKLRNKKTGEIKDVESLGHEKSLRDKYGPQITLSWNTEYENLGECRTYNSLAELNEEWEDAPEELKGYWYIDECGAIMIDQVLSSEINLRKSIGNYFETKEEAEKVVEKLKALKRLKDKGVEFYGWRKNHTGTYDFLARWRDVPPKMHDIINDLDLLFGGEE